MSSRIVLPLAITLMVTACRDAPDERPSARAVAERLALDTAEKAWRHSVGVDTVLQRGDTTVVWVSPRDWMATDAPQAGVHVDAAGRIARIDWIMGG